MPHPTATSRRELDLVVEAGNSTRSLAEKLLETQFKASLILQNIGKFP